MGEAFLGIDIGTSACKILALSSEGQILARGTAAYGIAQPRPGWSEQDPALWIEAVRAALAGVLAVVRPEEIAGIGLTGQMHGLTPVDRDHKVLRPAILWNDQRNAHEAEELTRLAGGAAALRQMTNNRMLAGYTGGKILWLQRHEAHLFERMRHALNPKDYLRLVLTGEVTTEVSDASGTGLFDTRRRQWSDDLLARMPFDAALLPPCFESSEVTGRVSRSGAALFGLSEGTPVIGGGGDAVVQTLGSGISAAGDLQTTIGTAGILAAVLDTPRDNDDGRLQIFCNVAPESWHCMGVSLNAGGAMAWLRNVLAGTSGSPPTFDSLVAAAEKSIPGAGGLLFLPYLNGERCPHPDPAARGGFIGLTARHGAGDMVRATMEGVVFALYDIFALMRRIGVEGSLIKASGGGARAPLWRQIQADLFECDVVTTEGAAEGAAFGAALLAGVGCGGWRDTSEAARLCRPLTRQHPDRYDGARYRELYSAYAALYPALTESFATLSALSATETTAT